MRKLPDGVVEVVLMARNRSPHDPQADAAASSNRSAILKRRTGRWRACGPSWATTRRCARPAARGTPARGTLHLGAPFSDWTRRPSDDPPSRAPARPADLRSRPLPLPARPRHEPDGWMLRGLEQGPGRARARVPTSSRAAGGTAPVHREYHFAETQKGELLWVSTTGRAGVGISTDRVE